MEGSINMRNNLIQNFYIIGVPYQDIITYIDSNETINLSKSFNPEILSKFPKDIDNMNTISDNLIIEHCFPNDFYIKKGGGKYAKNLYPFEFSFDNKNYQFLEKNRYLYSKIHFTCIIIKMKMILIKKKFQKNMMNIIYLKLFVFLVYCLFLKSFLKY